MTHQVNLWGSHPDKGNDDCWTGSDFESLAEAEAAFSAPLVEFDGYCHARNVEYIELVGPGVRRLRVNPSFAPQDVDDSDWRRELVMEAGMLHGLRGIQDLTGD